MSRRDISRVLGGTGPLLDGSSKVFGGTKLMFNEWGDINECEVCEGTGIVWAGYGGNEIEVCCPECSRVDEWDGIKQED